MTTPAWEQAVLRSLVPGSGRNAPQSTAVIRAVGWLGDAAATPRTTDGHLGSDTSGRSSALDGRRSSLDT